MKATARAFQRPWRRRLAGGFSLIELMLVVCMIGILSSIGGVAWMRYVKKSRTTEAVGHLQKLWAGSMTYYEADHANSAGAMLDKQFPGNCAPVTEANCCNNPDQRCPGSNPVFNGEPWKSLGYNISDRHLYRPFYYACPDPKRNMHAEVRGDLDCDGIPSIFIRKADVLPNGDVQGYATPASVNETE
jgi:prepilin-type N-terminal cleavage/methylation domain-containing protein